MDRQMTVAKTSRLRPWVAEHRMAAFVILTYAIMNGAWWPMLIAFPSMTMEQHFSNPSHLPFVYLAGASPTWAALIITYYLDGKAGLAALGRKFKVRAPLWTWILAFILPMLTALAAIVIYSAFIGSLGQIAWPVWYLIIPPFALLLFIAGPLSEETGWRGFLQPLVVERYGFLVSSLIIGTIWTFWHVPFMFTVGGTSPINTFWDLFQYWVAVVAHSAMFIVLIPRAKGSIWVAMAFHWSINASMSAIVQPLFPNATGAQHLTTDTLDSAVTAALAIIIFLWLPKARQRVEGEIHK
jgi:uncharacterized protein